MADLSNKDGSQSAMEAAGNARNAVRMGRDIARLVAGDLSAIKDLLTNQLLWEIVLISCLLVAMIGLVLGASFTGVINYIAEHWKECWDANYMDQAIISGGDLHYLRTEGWLETLGNTIVDVVSDVWNFLTGKAQSESAGRDNSQLQSDFVGKNPEASDYLETMQAITGSAALSEALKDRIQMIQTRVIQRGLQIEEAVQAQYISNRDSVYQELLKSIGETVSERYESSSGVTYLYAGYDAEAAMNSFTFDMTPFQLSDLQALKILALFSVQHDCQIEETDMWTLMDYCGWFDPKAPSSPLQDRSDSIYATVDQNITFGNDIGGITTAGQNVVVAGCELPDLQVPVWTGSCAPQWYYEELAQIRKHNKDYMSRVESGGDLNGMVPWGLVLPSVTNNTYTYSGYAQSTETSTNLVGAKIVVSYVYHLVCDGQIVAEVVDPPEGVGTLTFTDLKPNSTYVLMESAKRTKYKLNGKVVSSWIQQNVVIDSFTTAASMSVDEKVQGIDTSKFDNLKNVQTFSIIDQLFYCSANTLEICRTEYSSAGSFSEATIESLGEEIASFWRKYVWPRSKSSGFGFSGPNIVTRGANGNHSYSYNIELAAPETVQFTDDQGNTKTYLTEHFLCLYKSDGFESDSLDEILANAANKVGETLDYQDTLFWDGLEGSTPYTVYILVRNTFTETDKDGNLIRDPEISEHLEEEDFFTTFADSREAEAYKLFMRMTLKYEARSVDEIAFDVIGLWPGDLSDTTKVTHQTYNGNLIGTTEKDGATVRSVRLLGGITKLIAMSDASLRPNYEDGTHVTTKRSVSERIDDEASPLFRTVIREYCLSDRMLTRVNDVPSSGWRQVHNDGDGIVFDNLKVEKDYYAYLRITVIKQELQESGNTTMHKSTYLYLIDTIEGYGFNKITIGAGSVYADGHLGNELLRTSWTDLYRETGTHSTPAGHYNLRFKRITGYQYESYVDMVMMLCEMLGVDYSQWDAALKRAEELGYQIPGT